MQRVAKELTLAADRKVFSNKGRLLGWLGGFHTDELRPILMFLTDTQAQF